LVNRAESPNVQLRVPLKVSYYEIAGRSAATVALTVSAVTMEIFPDARWSA